MSITTYGDLKQAIINDLNRDDLTDVVADYLEEVIQGFQSSFFSAIPTTVYLDTVAGQVKYDMPSDLVSITWMRLNLSNVWQWMQKVEYSTLLGLDTIVPPIQSVPSMWAPFGTQFRIYTSPNIVYQLELTGNGRIPVPDDDSESNFWTTRAAGMIRAATLATIYARRVKNNEAAQQNAILAEQRRIELMREAVDRSTMRQMTAWW